MKFVPRRDKCNAASSNTSASRGFTLVELLVVIGIIALLVGLLLPVLAKAREAGNQVKCLSNMRQIVVAMRNFANDHGEYMPAGATGTKPYFLTNSYQFSSGNYKQLSTPPAGQTLADTVDWIAWLRFTDPITGVATGQLDENITYSGLAKYLGAPTVMTAASLGANKNASNDINAALEAIYRCPSDSLEQRPKTGPTSSYRYSYTMNEMYEDPPSNQGPGGKNIRSWNGVLTVWNGKLSGIKNPSSQILLFDEDETTISNGQCYPTNLNWFATSSPIGFGTDELASRHDRKNAATLDTIHPNTPNQDIAHGNVAFVDGHGEFVSRKDALRQKFTGNPQNDVAGF